MKELKELRQELRVGAKIKIGSEYSKVHTGFKSGQIIELIQGYFDEDNGLYSYTSEAPSIKSIDEDDEYDSIYHLFGNNFENWMDCEVVR